MTLSWHMTGRRVTRLAGKGWNKVESLQWSCRRKIWSKMCRFYIWAGIAYDLDILLMKHNIQSQKIKFRYICEWRSSSDWLFQTNNMTTYFTQLIFFSWCFSCFQQGPATTRWRHSSHSFESSACPRVALQEPVSVRDNIVKRTLKIEKVYFF